MVTRDKKLPILIYEKVLIYFLVILILFFYECRRPKSHTVILQVKVVDTSSCLLVDDFLSLLRLSLRN